MPMIELIGASVEMKQKNLSSQRTINFILKQLNDAGVKSPKFLAPTPGAMVQLPIGTALAEDCRGLYVASSGPSPTREPVLYGVWGSTVYRFNQSLTAAYDIGNIAGGSGSVSMTDNGFFFIVVDGSDMWKYPLLATDADANILSAVQLPYAAGIDPPELIKPTHVGFLAQRLIVNAATTNQWYFTDLPLPDGSPIFQDSNFYSAESSSDPCRALMVSNGSLWIYGYRSYEIWRSGGQNQDDPFSFVGGSQSSIGIQAINSLATVNNYIFWLGSSDVGAAGVYMGNSTSADRISTPAIEDQIGSIKDKTEAIGWCYSEKGYMYYLLSFPTANRTFVYECITQTWTERLRMDQQTALWLVNPYQYGVYFNNEIYCGLIGGHSPILCRMNDEIYTDFDGIPVTRQRITQVYFEEFNRIQTQELVVDMEVGTTPFLIGQGSDPHMQLEVSRDGGNTYGNVQKKSIGKQGNYRKIVRWNTCTTGRAFTYRLTFADNCSCSIYSGRLNYKPCVRT